MKPLAAIIPAAGCSSRMGQSKPLLPLGNGIVLSRIIDIFRANGIARTIVVTSSPNSGIAEAAKLAGAVPVCNAAFAQGMYSSVLAGIKAIPDDTAAFFVLPADIPLARRETIARLIEEFERTNPTILYPRFMGKRGHPPLISRELLPEILDHDGTGGLRRVLEAYEAEAQDLDVADSGTLRDMDTPTEYALARSLAEVGHPSDEECHQLWNMLSLPADEIVKCRNVAHVADALCESLNTRKGSTPLDAAMVRGTALSHAMSIGTAHLRTHGFHAAADLLDEHACPSSRPELAITEQEILLIADMLVADNSSVVNRTRTQSSPEYSDRTRTILDRFEKETDIKATHLARKILGCSC